jgi:acetyl esterase/lipase
MEIPGVCCTLSTRQLFILAQVSSWPLSERPLHMRRSSRHVFACVVAATVSTAMLSAQRLGPQDVNALPSRPADERVNYATGDALQFGELRLPKARGPFPVAIVIHGGCWVSTFATLQNTAAFADALRDAGVATWNVEYRRLDNPGGGWPGTFADVAAAADYVATLAKRHDLDLSRVAAVGHSAGAHLALWLAARSRLPSSSPLYQKAPLRLRGVVALGGPGDLRDFTTYARSICGAPVIEQLIGGTPQAVPARYAQASPAELLPFGTRQILIVGTEDSVMPPRARNAYVAAALKAGDQAESIAVPEAGHFETIAPVSAAWPIVRDKILELLGHRGG